MSRSIYHYCSNVGETHNKFEHKNHKSRTFSFWTNIAYLMSKTYSFYSYALLFVKLSLVVKTTYSIQPVSYINQKGEDSIQCFQ